MKSSFFAKNLWIALAFVVLIQETVSSRFELYLNVLNAPLALIKKPNSTKLELAIPQKSRGYGEYADYSQYDCEDENGSVECLVACRVSTNNYAEYEVELNWKSNNNIPKESSLHLYDKYTEMRSICSSYARPSIEKVQKKNEDGKIVYCGEFEAEIYNVGFWVSKKDGTNVQFIPIYKICYSTTENKGMQYTAHRIASPSLLLEEVWEYSKPKPEAKDLYKCILDENINIEELVDEKHFAHPFVGIEDMPTKVWGTTTQFSFNYTPITLNIELMKGMVAVDNYIRLFSRKTDTPLTLYSGTYETTVNRGHFQRLPKMHPKERPVHSFWRIIMDDEGLAVIIIIQHTENIKCDEETFICHENHTMLKLFKKGGCIYTCSVNEGLIERLKLPRNEIIEKLEFPQIKFKGDLKLIFRKRLSKKAMKNGQSAADENPSNNVSISDFLGEMDFEDALSEADPHLASEVYVHPPSTTYGGDYGKSHGKSGGRGGILSMFTFSGMSDGGGGGGGGEGGGGGRDGKLKK